MEDVFLKKKIGFWIVIVIILAILPAIGQQQKVVAVEIEGNRKFPEKKLLKMLNTKKGKEYDPKNLYLDKTILRNHYLKNGFMDVWVDSKLNRKKNQIFVKFIIEEGVQYFYTGYSLDSVPGSDILVIKKILDNLKAGTVYNQSVIDQKVKEIEDYYYNNGHPYVHIVMNKEVVQDSNIVLHCEVFPGKQVLIEDIEILGISQVEREIVSREILLGNGDLYSRRNIQLSQKNLYSTGLFETVSIRVASLPGDSSRAILKVQVSEKKMKYIGFRFSFSFEENTTYGTVLELPVEFGHLNLFNRGRSMRISASPSFHYDTRQKKIKNIQNQIVLTYVHPWFLLPRYEGKFDIAYFQRKPPNFFHYDVWNYSLSFYRAGEMQKNNFIFSYQYITNIQKANGDSTPLAGGEEEDILKRITSGNEKILTVRYEKRSDKRDNIIAPNKGYLTAFKFALSYSQKMGDTVLNKSSTYSTIDFSWNRYQAFPLYKKAILASRVRLGYIHLFGKSNFIPIPERFFLGGASTIRGFYDRQVGPVSITDGNPVYTGGRILFLSNLELRIPFLRYFFATTFVDAGYVWNYIRDISPDDIRVSAGGGLAFSPGFIVIRTEYGFNVFRKTGEQQGVLHFGISFAF